MPNSAMHVYALHDGTKSSERKVAAVVAALKLKDIHVSCVSKLGRNSLRPASWDACLVFLSRGYLRLVDAGGDEEGGNDARALFEASTASCVPKVFVALEATLPTQLPGVVGERLGSPMTIALHQDPEHVELERVIRLQRPRSAFRGACKRVVARNRLVLLEAKPAASAPPVPATGIVASEFRARVQRIASALDISSEGGHLADVVERALKTLRVRCGADTLFCERVAKLERHLGLAAA